MNILWILEDALRPAHMGCYGYGKDTTPNCDTLARGGVRFETCLATASHTLPSIISMIMGQTSATHGIVNCERFRQWKFEGLWDGVSTPLHVLEDRGYLIDGELVTRWDPLGFTRETATDEIMAFFSHNRDRRWFFYAEPYPTHLPYNPSDAYLDMFLDDGYRPTQGTLERADVIRRHLIVHPSGRISKLEAGEADPLPDDDADEAHKRTAGTVDLQPEDEPFVRALYDGEVRAFDDLVGAWVQRLQSLGILEETLVIVTADHGEELMERGHVGHSSCNLAGTLYDECIRVPLVMHCPGRLPAGHVVHQQVSVIDIMPTIFELLGCPPWAGADGSSLLGLATDPNTATFRSEAFAETTPAGWQALQDDDREIWCLRTAEWKLILNTDARESQRQYELYDLRSDPGERTSIFGTGQDVEPRLIDGLDAYVAQARRIRG